MSGEDLKREESLSTPTSLSTRSAPSALSAFSASPALSPPSAPPARIAPPVPSTLPVPSAPPALSALPVPVPRSKTLVQEPLMEGPAVNKLGDTELRAAAHNHHTVNEKVEGEGDDSDDASSSSSSSCSSCSSSDSDDEEEEHQGENVRKGAVGSKAPRMPIPGGAAVMAVNVEKNEGDDIQISGGGTDEDHAARTAKKVHGKRDAMEMMAEGASGDVVVVLDDTDGKTHGEVATSASCVAIKKAVNGKEEDQKEEEEETAKQRWAKESIAELPIFTALGIVSEAIVVRACTKCALCKMPPCGECKMCKLNAKMTPEQLQHNKRRCERLQCERKLMAAGFRAPDAKVVQQIREAHDAVSDLQKNIATLDEAIRVAKTTRDMNDIGRLSAERTKAVHDLSEAQKRVLDLGASIRRQGGNTGGPGGAAQLQRERNIFARGKEGSSEVISYLHTLNTLRRKLAIAVVEDLKGDSKEGCEAGSACGDKAQEGIAVKIALRDATEEQMLQTIVTHGTILTSDADQERFWKIAHQSIAMLQKKKETARALKRKCHCLSAAASSGGDVNVGQSGPMAISSSTAKAALPKRAKRQAEDDLNPPPAKLAKCH